MENILEIKNISKKFSHFKGAFSSSKSDFFALQDINFEIRKNEILALVGESGSGKSTLANLIMKLDKPTSGEILFEGKNIFDFNKYEMKNYRANAQIIFQNPYSSLNPKMKVVDILSEPLEIFGVKDKKEIEARVSEISDFISFASSDLKKFPFEFSGGQRQRIAIARALILKPKFIIADEPTSALDVSIQAQIINLLLDMKHEFKVSYLFISHDINLVRYLADRVCILNSGKVAEINSNKEIFNNPQKEYTKKLLSSVVEI